MSKHPQGIAFKSKVMEFSQRMLSGLKSQASQESGVTDSE